MHYITSKYDIKSIKDFFQSKVLGLDTETNNTLNPKEGFLRLVQISDGSNVAIIDLKECYPDYWNGKDIKGELTLKPLKELLEDPQYVKIIHNAKFDYKWIYHHLGIEVENIFDTMLAHQLIKYDDRHSLSNVTKKYLNLDLDKTEQNTDWCGDLSEEKLEYAKLDVIYLPTLREKLKQVLVNDRLVKVADLEFSCIPAYSHIELNGLNVNSKIYREKIEIVKELHKKANINLHKSLNDEADVFVQTSLIDLVPEQVKSSTLTSSPKQVKEKLQQKGVPIIDENWHEVRKLYGNSVPNETVQESKERLNQCVERVINRYESDGRLYATGTGEKALALIIDLYQELRPLDEFRKLDKLLTSYGENILDNLKDGRLYPDYRIIGAPTGRNSTSKPSVQNIPDKKVKLEGEEYEVNLRQAFDFPKGFVGHNCDLPNIELRVMAELSGDDALIKVFNEGRDLHSDTASRLFGIPYDDLLEGSPNYSKVKEKRKTAKIINFAVPYGAGKFRIAKQLNCSEEEAEAIIRKYAESYPQLWRWLQHNGETALRTLQIRTVLGRLHRFNPPLTKREEGAIRRNGLNTPIQGSAADIMKRCVVLVHNAIKPYGAKIVSVVHDEINTESPVEHKDTVRKLISQEMTRGCMEFLKKVNIKVEAKEVKNWGEK